MKKKILWHGACVLLLGGIFTAIYLYKTESIAFLPKGNEIVSLDFPRYANLPRWQNKSTETELKSPELEAQLHFLHPELPSDSSKTSFAKNTPPELFFHTICSLTQEPPLSTPENQKETPPLPLRSEPIPKATPKIQLSEKDIEKQNQDLQRTDWSKKFSGKMQLCQRQADYLFSLDVRCDEAKQAPAPAVLLIDSSLLGNPTAEETVHRLLKEEITDIYVLGEKALRLPALAWGTISFAPSEFSWDSLWSALQQVNQTAPQSALLFLAAADLPDPPMPLFGWLRSHSLRLGIATVGEASALLSGLAQIGGGILLTSETLSSLPRKCVALLRTLRAPVLTHLRCNLVAENGEPVHFSTLLIPPTLYVNQPLSITGSLSHPEPLLLNLRATAHNNLSIYAQIHLQPKLDTTSQVQHLWTESQVLSRLLLDAEKAS